VRVPLISKSKVPKVAIANHAGLGLPRLGRTNLANSGSSGRALDRLVKDYFERQFQWDFGSVRVHADERSARSAAGIGARAFTVGTDIAFGPGERPGINRLTVHELAHVVQNEISGDVQTVHCAPAPYSIVSVKTSGEW